MPRCLLLVSMRTSTPQILTLSPMLAAPQIALLPSLRCAVASFCFFSCLCSSGVDWLLINDVYFLKLDHQWQLWYHRGSDDYCSCHHWWVLFCCWAIFCTNIIGKVLVVRCKMIAWYFYVSHPEDRWWAISQGLERWQGCQLQHHSQQHWCCQGIW